MIIKTSELSTGDTHHKQFKNHMVATVLQEKICKTSMEYLILSEEELNVKKKQNIRKNSMRSR